MGIFFDDPVKEEGFLEYYVRFEKMVMFTLFITFVWWLSKQRTGEKPRANEEDNPNEAIIVSGPDQESNVVLMDHRNHQSRMIFNGPVTIVAPPHREQAFWDSLIQKIKPRCSCHTKPNLNLNQGPSDASLNSPGPSSRQPSRQSSRQSSRPSSAALSNSSEISDNDDLSD